MKHSVLITGASTGIGHAVAAHLAQAGHQVFAGVRKSSDAEKWKAENSSVTPIIIDVVKSESISEAVKQIEKLRDRTKPFCLVNNAGVAVPGPVEALKISEFRRQFEVNFFGLIEATQKFLPMIRESRGRIVNISSVGGRISTPFLGAYSASKFAVEALSDSLRQELSPFGVKVVIIEPGSIQSDIWNKSLDNKEQTRALCDPEALKVYEKRVTRFEKIAAGEARAALPALNVAQKVAAALELENPPARMLVTTVGRRLQVHAVAMMPTRLYDKIVSKVIKAD